MEVKQTSLRVIGKMSRKDLTRAISLCFEYAPDASPIDRLAVLQEAQFYTQELERRHDSWISIRDFMLEIAVLVLIGWEIHMSYRAERLQKENFSDEKMFFETLEKSSGATADILASLKTTTETMNGAIQKQVELFYDVEVTVAYNQPAKTVELQNQGRTNVSVWGMHVGTAGKADFFTEGHIIAASGGRYETSAENIYELAKHSVAKGVVTTIPFFLFVKNERGQRFTMRGNIVTGWQGETLNLLTQTTQITPGWEMK